MSSRKPGVAKPKCVCGKAVFTVEGEALLKAQEMTLARGLKPHHVYRCPSVSRLLDVFHVSSNPRWAGRGNVTARTIGDQT